ncbi:MAG: hypothetical protein OEV74_17255 [Cyclobacteriaceae bacterium]|jgi:hypothetical protein|nr:hypothetical protein [Cyclobacteriaceae bacterium]MDH4298030.1 hypothetical protein [Cyclobacteriaceae bacterium]MDH5248533.1 hypothetical protein [Cyclobacteriaceae bacterium]
MANIRFKKQTYPVSKALRGYLMLTGREIDVPISYHDLLHYNSSVALFDKKGNDTLWETLIYNQTDREFIHDCLRKVYAQLKVGGDVGIMDHLYIDRVDYCLYANTHPVRVRIVNRLNDLFDYFYVKQADMSRIYGMELEHMLSPNKINYLVKESTIIEEHIQGIPGDTFIKDFLTRQDFNPLRVAKEFVKFNERSLVQLMGDMRNDNFLVEVIPDFDELYFRLRAIDFDQHCYEGSLKIYMPQYFKENNPIINLGFKSMSSVLELQYQKEERTRLLTRVHAAAGLLPVLLSAMKKEVLSTEENVHQLRAELSNLYEDDRFLNSNTMGDLLSTSLHMLEVQPVRKRKGVRVSSD